ncbi:uncharacterized protein LOC119682572, partial [Teleopsis dalmanni]|uniref:uncharacterized protein LOC119682572 n=1 Tax=Teleopsis dalmanni TaxID=139649 RepID=UPI0018CD9FB2
VKRHYKLVHKKDIGEKPSESEEENCEPANKKYKKHEFVKLDIDKHTFLKCCVGLVTSKNLPFRIFDDEDFFKLLLKPYERKFGSNLNSRNIVSLLDNSCIKIQEIIKARLTNKMLSLKLDIATRMDKNILGINIQYIKDFKIYINTIGKCCQIYSSTTDNGANMVKVSEILQDIQEEHINEDFNQEECSNNDENIHAILASVLSVVRCAA